MSIETIYHLECPSNCGSKELRLEDEVTKRVQCLKCGWRAALTEEGTATDWQPGWRGNARR
jgi:hypothetical protein